MEEKQVSLDPRFDSAILGTSVHPGAEPRIIYSLSQLTRILVMRDAVTHSNAVARIGNLVLQVTEEHGDRSPIFADDFHNETPLVQIS